MIYFDNASTTKVGKSVLDEMTDFYTNCFANPSSLHGLGFEAECRMNEAREKIAKRMNVPSERLFFTSGGTEANNWAVLGTASARKRRGKRVITSVIEHPSVADSFTKLEKEGWEVIRLSVDEKGYVNEDELLSAVNDETVLVSIMYVNNEFGTVQDIHRLVKEVKRIAPDVVFHTDCVQAFMKHSLPTEADLISISGHKVHAPKGIGALYIKKGVRIDPIHFGGTQEQALRPGTENIGSVVAFGKASEEGTDAAKVLKVREILLGLKECGAVINGDEENGSPYILNCSFEGVKGEVLLHALENEGIYVATGSACSSRAKKKNKIVDLLKDGRGEGAVRFSFCDDNTEEEAYIVKAAVEKCVNMLKKYR